MSLMETQTVSLSGKLLSSFRGAWHFLKLGKHPAVKPAAIEGESKQDMVDFFFECESHLFESMLETFERGMRDGRKVDRIFTGRWEVMIKYCDKIVTVEDCIFEPFVLFTMNIDEFVRVLRTAPRES